MLNFHIIQSEIRRATWSHLRKKGDTMTHIFTQPNRQTQAQIKQRNNNRKNNGHFNHYRFKEELDRL